MSQEQQLQQKEVGVEDAFNHLADSLKEMQAKEARIKALQEVVRKIRAPILKQGRAITAELRLEVNNLEKKIAEKEAPYRKDADDKTSDLRAQIKAEKGAYLGIKSATYNFVNPPPQAEEAQTSQA